MQDNGTSNSDLSNQIDHTSDIERHIYNLYAEITDSTEKISYKCEECLSHIDVLKHPGDTEQEVPAHWHYVTYGLSQVRFQHTESAQTKEEGERESRFELTLRVTHKDTDSEDSPPTWPLHVLRTFAEYIQQTGNVVSVGDHIPWNRALNETGDDSDGLPPGGSPGTHIKHLLVAEDPELMTMFSGLISIQFRQLVGVLEPEMKAAQSWKGRGVLDMLSLIPQAGGAYFLTDLSRESSVFDYQPYFTKLVSTEITSSGSNLAHVTASCSWEGVCSPDGTAQTITDSSGQLVEEVTLKSVTLYIDTEAAELLPIAARGRLAHDKYFVFESLAGEVIILVPPGCTEPMVSVHQQHPLTAQGPALQIYCGHDFICQLAEAVHAFAFQYQNHNMTREIHLNDPRVKIVITNLKEGRPTWSQKNIVETEDSKKQIPREQPCNGLESTQSSTDPDSTSGANLQTVEQPSDKSTNSSNFLGNEKSDILITNGFETEVSADSILCSNIAICEDSGKNSRSSLDRNVTGVNVEELNANPCQSVNVVDQEPSKSMLYCSNTDSSDAARKRKPPLPSRSSSKLSSKSCDSSVPQNKLLDLIHNNHMMDESSSLSTHTNNHSVNDVSQNSQFTNKEVAHSTEHRYISKADTNTPQFHEACNGAKSPGNHFAVLFQTQDQKEVSEMTKPQISPPSEQQTQVFAMKGSSPRKGHLQKSPNRSGGPVTPVTPVVRNKTATINNRIHQHNKTSLLNTAKQHLHMNKVSPDVVRGDSKVGTDTKSVRHSPANKMMRTAEVNKSDGSYTYNTYSLPRKKKEQLSDAINWHSLPRSFGKKRGRSRAVPVDDLMSQQPLSINEKLISGFSDLQGVSIPGVQHITTPTTPRHTGSNTSETKHKSAFTPYIKPIQTQPIATNSSTKLSHSSHKSSRAEFQANPKANLGNDYQERQRRAKEVEVKVEDFEINLNDTFMSMEWEDLPLPLPGMSMPMYEHFQPLRTSSVAGSTEGDIEDHDTKIGAKVELGICQATGENVIISAGKADHDDRPSSRRVPDLSLVVEESENNQTVLEDSGSSGTCTPQEDLDLSRSTTPVVDVSQDQYYEDDLVKREPSRNFVTNDKSSACKLTYHHASSPGESAHCLGEEPPHCKTLVESESSPTQSLSEASQLQNEHTSTHLGKRNKTNSKQSIYSIAFNDLNSTSESQVRYDQELLQDSSHTSVSQSGDITRHSVEGRRQAASDRYSMKSAGSFVSLNESSLYTSVFESRDDSSSASLMDVSSDTDIDVAATQRISIPTPVMRRRTNRRRFSHSSRSDGGTHVLPLVAVSPERLMNDVDSTMDLSSVLDDSITSEVSLSRDSINILYSVQMNVQEKVKAAKKTEEKSRRRSVLQDRTNGMIDPSVTESSIGDMSQTQDSVTCDFFHSSRDADNEMTMTSLDLSKSSISTGNKSRRLSVEQTGNIRRSSSEKESSGVEASVTQTSSTSQIVSLSEAKKSSSVIHSPKHDIPRVEAHHYGKINVRSSSTKLSGTDAGMTPVTNKHKQTQDNMHISLRHSKTSMKNTLLDRKNNSDQTTSEIISKTRVKNKAPTIRTESNLSANSSMESPEQNDTSKSLVRQRSPKSNTGLLSGTPITVYQTNSNKMTNSKSRPYHFSTPNSQYSTESKSVSSRNQQEKSPKSISSKSQMRTNRPQAVQSRSIDDPNGTARDKIMSESSRESTPVSQRKLNHSRSTKPGLQSNEVIRQSKVASERLITRQSPSTPTQCVLSPGDYTNDHSISTSSRYANSGGRVSSSRDAISGGQVSSSRDSNSGGRISSSRVVNSSGRVSSSRDANSGGRVSSSRDASSAGRASSSRYANSGGRVSSTRDTNSGKGTTSSGQLFSSKSVPSSQQSSYKRDTSHCTDGGLHHISSGTSTPSDRRIDRRRPRTSRNQEPLPVHKKTTQRVKSVSVNDTNKLKTPVHSNGAQTKSSPTKRKFLSHNREESQL